MTTTPTQEPVASESYRDLKYNAGKIDEFVTSMALKYADRFGGEHYTIEGLRWLAQQAIAQYGWIPIGTFQAGAEITLPNQILKDETDGEYYRWDGEFPKSVASGSTPSTTGGVGTGAWLSVGDSTLRQYVDSTYRKTGYSIKPDKTFQTGAVLAAPNEVLYDDSTRLYWMWAGEIPKTVNAGDNPAADSNYYAVGMLNDRNITDLSSWCDTVSNVDVTFEMQQYFRTLGHLGLKAYGSGVVTVSSRITIPNVEFDFSNLTITISPNSDSSVSGGGGKVLHLTDPDTVELSGQPFTTSNIGQMGTIQLSGPRYRNCTVGIEGEGSSNRAYYRGTFGTYTNAFDLYVMDDSGTGYHGDTPALFKYNGTAKHVVRPIRPQMIIRGPTFVLPSPLSESRSLRCCIEIERNGVTLIGGTMNSQASGLRVESFVSLHNVTDCSVVDVKMLNNNAQANYVVLAFCTNRLTVQRCRSLSGWALVDGNFMRNTVVTDSYGATIGCHAMAWNFTVERCTLAPTVVAGKYQGGVSVTGGGMLRVTDLTYTYMGGDRSIDHPVSTRGDYGQSWEGDVLIERVTLRVGAVPASGQGIAVFYANGADLGAIDLTRDCYLGGKRLEIRETRIQITSAAWAAADLVISPMWPQTTFTQNVRYPSDYIVDGWVVETSGPGYTLDPRWVTLVTNTNAVPGITRNVFRDIQWPSTSVGFIGPTASTAYRVTPEITIEDSRSGFYISQLALPAGGRFTIRRSTIINMVLGNPNGSGEYFIEHCFINGTNAGGSPASADKAYYYQNHITTTNTVTVGSIAKYCHGNTVVSSGSISGRTVDEWYSYRDSTTFRTT